MKQLLFSLIISFFATTILFAQRGDGAVIPGDFADPSIIRVGQKYFAVGTSSEWAPHFPIYESSNLKNWTQQGYVFNIAPEWTSGSFWAPEYFKIGSKYYIYYSARRKSDNSCYIGVATSNYPDKGFKDHGVILAYGKETIDPFIFNDGGQLYITYKAFGVENRPIEILASKLSQDGLRIDGTPFTLLKDEKRIGMEGQSILKRNGYYYIFYSAGDCCGAGCSYQVGVARSRSFSGPYQYFNQNPVLSENNHWKCMGHGSFVDAPNGRQYYLHHAYNKSTSVATGRQGLISELTWPSKQNWPKLIPQQILDTTRNDIYDNFSSKNLMNYWQWDFRNSSPLITQKNKVLTLGGNTMTNNPVGIVLTTRPVAATFSMQVTVLNKNNALKGLAFYGDANAAIGLGVQGNQILVWQVVDKKFSILLSESITIDMPVRLELEVDSERIVRFKYRQSNMDWKNLAAKVNLKEILLQQWDRSPRPGLHYQGRNTENANFSNFSLVYGDQ